MKKLICFTILAFLLVPFTFAQNKNAEIFRDRTRTPLICAFTSSSLYAGPGKSMQQKRRINFGEIVQRAGRKAYVGSEKRTYIEVKTESGKTGWVDQFRFINNGSAGVVQNKSQIYSRPRSGSSLTQDHFAAGEKVILSTVSGDWVELFSENKAMKGWIKGLNRVSTRKDQLAAADLNKRTGVRSYQNTGTSSSSSGSSDDIYSPSNKAPTTRGGQEFYPNSVLATRSQDNASRGEIVGNLRTLTTAQRPRTRSQSSNSRYQNNSSYTSSARKTQTTYRNPQTGALVRSITEQGPIYSVNFPTEGETLFVGYHKTLPVGSKVKIPFPDNPGFVEIEIIGSLRDQRPEVLGLYPACVALIFGNNAPDQIKFTYLDKK